MSIGKKLGLSILAVLLAVTLTVNVWYVWIYFFGPERIIAKTFKVGTLTTSDGTTHNIFEVEYFANKDKSGYEAFEIKFTNFMDESKDDIFIQGLQYLSTSTKTNISIDYSHNCLSKDKTSSNYNLFTGHNIHYNCKSSYSAGSTTDYYNYMSSDDIKFMKSTNPLTIYSGYKIQVGEDIYLMKFKGLSTPTNTDTYITTTKDNNAYNDYFHHQYHIYDVNFFVKLLYEAVKTLDYGTEDDIVFEWGNLFNYYKYYESTKKYDENPTDYTNVKLVSGDIKSYYSIKVKTHEKGLSKSSDSLFGSILGNGSIDLNNESISDNYFVGRTVVDVDLSSFDLVVVQDNYAALKLTQSFLDYYTQYKNLIVLDIEIDLDDLTNAGYSFSGFSDNHGLDMFEIYRCYTVSNGEVVDDFTNSITEVAV